MYQQENATPKAPHNATVIVKKKPYKRAVVFEGFVTFNAIISA